MQQFVVDSWVKTEQNRLNFIRMNQRQLRLDTVRGLTDFIMSDETNRNGSVAGQRIILAASYHGGPRDMVSSYQDAMAITAKYGKPDLFLTFTCNPQWEEIKNALYPGQVASDRPDLIARVFNLKLKALSDEILKRHALGEVAAHIHVIEFQKRGLPHAHMLLTMKGPWKPRTSAEVDSLICAEFPDPQEDPDLHAVVASCMVHRPCGIHNPNAPCMVDGKCSKRFPKLFRDQTNTGTDGYPEYRRRDDGRTIQSGRTTLDNRSVVPYNPYLSRMFKAHINLEVCTQITVVKYLFKYVYKGTDRASLSLTRDGSDGSEIVDEIKQHLDARYVCPPESAHRLFGFEMQARSDSVQRLQVHLPGFESVIFEPGQEANAVENSRDSTLTAWFKINAKCHELETQLGSLPENEVDSRRFHYWEMPEHFTFVKGEWKPRKRSSRTIGRMYFVGPRDRERFALRLLLLYTKGASSFDSLRSVNGVNHDTFLSAAKASGMLADDDLYVQLLEEAIQFQMPRQLRSLFATLLSFCEVSDCNALWEQFKVELSADFCRTVTRVQAEALAYFEIADKIAIHGQSISSFITAVYQPVDLPDNIADPTVLAAKGADMYGKLNLEQKQAVDKVLTAVTEQSGCMLFIDGPGGSGKTFVYTCLNNILAGLHKKVLNVAWTGIAANLLPNGRTVNSAFKLRVSDNSKSSSMKAQCKEAGELRSTDVFIWDEAPMAPVQALEAVDALLRDLTQDSRPFGGKVVVLGGDFRQILPVVERGGRDDIVAACIKKSHLWSHFVTLKLSSNMRVSGNDDQWKQFLLDVGDGKVACGPSGEVVMSEDLFCRGDLAREVFGIALDGQSPEALCNLAILTPRNIDAHRINNAVLEMLPSEKRVYRSIDSVVTENPSDAINFPTEFLNKMLPTGLPPHELYIKEGCIIMLLRNLDVKHGLCNGTRLIVKQPGRQVLGCEFANGSRKGDFVLIPRIDCTYDRGIPFVLKRRQFPVRLSFAMTINKSQGQTFDRVGICLEEPIFSHGQLYVALSRARSREGIRIVARNDVVNNVVYDEVL